MDEKTFCLITLSVVISCFVIILLLAGRKTKRAPYKHKHLTWPLEPQEGLSPYEKSLMEKAKQDTESGSPNYTPGMGQAPFFTKEYTGLFGKKYPVCTQCAGSVNNGVCEYCKTKQQ